MAVSDSKPIEDVVQAWSEAWNARDLDAVMGLWDEDDPDSTYIPAEKDAPLIGHAVVRDYVQSLCTIFDTVRHRPESIIVKRLADNISLSFYVLDWAVADRRGPIGGRYRITGLWRKRGDDWKLTQYSEAPLAPLIELKEFYQRVVADGLPP